MGNSVEQYLGNDWASQAMGGSGLIDSGDRGSSQQLANQQNAHANLTPQVQAEAIIAAAKQHEQNRQDLIARLQAQRDNIDEALAVLLGHKKPTPAKKRGRPTGTKNREKTKETNEHTS